MLAASGMPGGQRNPARMVPTCSLRAAVTPRLHRLSVEYCCSSSRTQRMSRSDSDGLRKEMWFST